jgi:hypothetical protein
MAAAAVPADTLSDCTICGDEICWIARDKGVLRALTSLSVDIVNEAMVERKAGICAPKHPPHAQRSKAPEIRKLAITAVDEAPRPRPRRLAR